MPSYTVINVCGFGNKHIIVKINPIQLNSMLDDWYLHLWMQSPAAISYKFINIKYWKTQSNLKASFLKMVRNILGRLIFRKRQQANMPFVTFWFMVKIHFWGISSSRSTHLRAPMNNRGKLGPCSYALPSLKNRDCAVLPGQMAGVENKGTLKLRWRHWWPHHGNIPKFPTDAQSQTRLDLSISKRDVGQRRRHETTK